MPLAALGQSGCVNVYQVGAKIGTSRPPSNKAIAVEKSGGVSSKLANRGRNRPAND